jgi:hypothetical protein
VDPSNRQLPAFVWSSGGLVATAVVGVDLRVLLEWSVLTLGQISSVLLMLEAWLSAWESLYRVD